jgi:Concanavalin A-like lectin/glucanases superfamily
MFNISSRRGSKLSQSTGRGSNRGFHSKLLLTVLLSVALMAIQSNTAALANPVPVAAYSFDEGSGTTSKDSAGSHDGTIEAGASWASEGKYGSALSFDGEDDRVRITDSNDLDLTGPFTLEAWVKPETLTPQWTPVLVKVDGARTNGFLLSVNVGGAKPGGVLANNGSYAIASGTSELPTSPPAWSHLALTSDGSTLSFYVDGELKGAKTAIKVPATAYDLFIGHYGEGNGAFKGKIDEVRIYGQALSEAQLQADRDTAVGLDQMPVAAYSFDEGSGTTVKDVIGSHNGTISGASWATGKYGSALNFDGLNDLVSIPDAPELDLTKTFTLEAWVRPDDLAAARPVIAKGESSGGNSGYMLSAKYTTNAAGYVASSGSTTTVSASSALPTSPAWSHLALTSDGANLRLYIDGELKATATPSVTAKATAANLEIGHSFLGGHFDGLIDEVRLYGEALTQTQIQTDRDNRVEAPALREVTTTVLDAGPFSEKVSGVPITSSGIETAVYSLPVPSLKGGEILRITANLEVTNTHTYDVTDSIRLVLGSNASDSAGTVVTPWTSFQHTKDILHWTFPLHGVYHAPSNFGSTQYLKVVFKAASASAKAGETLTVQPNLGGLAATRYTPAVGPMSQPTHLLQPQIDPLTELVKTIPVDSNWRRVVTRKVGPLSYEDILDIAAQIEIQNPSAATVQLESKITRTTAPSTTGSWASQPIVERLSPSMPSTRVVHSNHFLVTDPGKPYLNLSLRAVPISGSPSPLVVKSDTATLNVMRYTPTSSIPTDPLQQGTLVDTFGDASPDVSSIPFAVAGGSEKRVVASAPIHGGIWKGEKLQARALITADLNGSSETTQILTRLILADSPTATTGTTIGAFSGDKVPPSAQFHTSVKEGVYLVPEAKPETKFINFVVYASQPNPVGNMNVPAASLSYVRIQPTAPLDEGFDSGLTPDGIDSVFEYEFNGTLSASPDQAREGESRCWLT